MSKTIYSTFKTTEEIPVPERLIDQVIGQDHAVEIVKKAARQKRNVLLIGEPGTGKSMLAQAMAELLPAENLEDILIYPNPADPNNPKVRVVRAGEGRKIVEEEKRRVIFEERPAPNYLPLILSLFYIGFIMFALYTKLFSDVILAAFIIMGGIMLGIVIFALALSQGPAFRLFGNPYSKVPKLLIDNANRKKAPFIDATGAKAGALLGDVKHDPYQSGGLGTPPHLRVEPGAIHRAHKGVLYIDEIATLSPKSQQELLTAMQERKYSITGQSELSSGAMVKTDPVPCDFILVASGNIFDLEKMHPALRSRIRGYGYEVYLNDSMPENDENRKKLIRFVAQEVKKDGRIPHFEREAVEEIIAEAKRRANRKRAYTLKLRDLGGLVRAAGDIALAKGHRYVKREDVLEAKKLAKTMEQQIAEKYIELKKEYEVIKTKGFVIGRVNGLAVLGREAYGGMLLPIEAEVVPSLSEKEGKIIATGKLGEIAREAVQNVSAIIKKYKGADISAYDIHIQFLQTYEGVEGDSASVSVATAVISALEKIPVKQSVAMTGSLSVKGEVLPVGGVTAKVEAAIDAGIKTIIVPRANVDDIVIEKEKLKGVKIVGADTILDVLKYALKEGKKKEQLIKTIQKVLKA